MDKTAKRENSNKGLPRIDLLRKQLAELAEQIGETYGAQVCLVVWPDIYPSPEFAGHGNDTGFAGMLREAAAVVTHSPGRPETCQVCQAAWDAMKAAELALTIPAGGCN